MTDAHDRGAACCAPQGRAVLPGAPGPADPRPSLRAGALRHDVEQAIVPAQTTRIGDSRGDANRGDGETPAHDVTVTAFGIDATTVTNDAFARFVADTGYLTDAERFGYSAVFHLARTAPDADVTGQPPATPWWLGVRGASWRHPGGAGSDIAAIGDHPVVHVSWDDAMAYCSWADRALPSEAQWEVASRGGLEGARFPWGDELRDLDGTHRANIWQGEFPVRNTLDDGYLTTAPVRTYQPNAYGLWQTVGNVWEWCADWWSPRTYTTRAADPDAQLDPMGPSTGDARVLRGGSFLCHDSYCNRYRNAARSSNTPDSSASNMGFRTVARAATRA